MEGIGENVSQQFVSKGQRSECAGRKEVSYWVRADVLQLITSHLNISWFDKCLLGKTVLSNITE